MDPQHTNTLPFITCFHGVYDPTDLSGAEAPPTILTIFTTKSPEEID